MSPQRILAYDAYSYESEDGVRSLKRRKQSLTVANADRIMVLEGGQIIEHGTEAELRGRVDGRYHALRAAIATD